MSYLSPEAYLPHEAPMMLLGSVECVTDDTLAPCGLLHQRTALTKPVILSNSFAFGGNNASILLGRAS